MPRAALRKLVERAVPSLLAASAPSHCTHARRAFSVLQKGAGEARAPPLTLSDLNSALSPLRDDVASLRVDVASLRVDMTSLRDDVASLRHDTTSLRSVSSATSDNVGALVEVVAGSAVVSPWSRTRVCSLSELAAAVLAHEEGGAESSAVVRLLCASLAPDAWRCLHLVAERLHKSFVALQRTSAAAEPLCDDTLELRERLCAHEPDWQCLEQLARLWEEGFQATPQRADEECVASAVRVFARKMAAAGTLSAVAGERRAARLLAEGDGPMREEGPSLAFVLATTLLSDAPRFEIDFDGIGCVSYCADTCVLTVPLMEVNTAPVQASDAARQLRLRATAACIVCVVAARRQGSPWASLQRVEVKGVVKLLHALRPQRLAQLRSEYNYVPLQLPAAGGVECILRTDFSVIGDSRARSGSEVAR